VPWAVVLLCAFLVYRIITNAYKVVPPHQAHVVVTRSKGRKLYSSRPGDKSSYFYFGSLQQRSVIPLENIKIEIQDIPLRDRDMAKFLADVRCFLNVQDHITASERLGKIQGEEDKQGKFESIEVDIKDLIQAITRNSSMTMDVFSIMKERKEFSSMVEKEINESIDEWGLKLINLEVIHFDDAPSVGGLPASTVISDLEARQAKVINTETRKQVAEEEKQAQLVEAVTKQESEEQKAKSELLYRTEQIRRDQEVGKRLQESAMAVAEATMHANEQAVKAIEALTIGNATVDKQKAILQAEALSEARKEAGRGDAEFTKVTGEASADVTKMQALAEAEGIDKKAEAQKKYNEAGAMAIEIITTAINASKDIEIAKYQQLGQALQKANVNIVSTGEKEMFGIPMGAESGIALGGMFKALKDSGFDVGEILSGVSSTVKEVIRKK
jgi:flotillin